MRSTSPVELETYHSSARFHVSVLILGRGIVGRTAETLILDELPRTGQNLELRSGRWINVENVTTTVGGFDAIVAGPIARPASEDAAQE